MSCAFLSLGMSVSFSLPTCNFHTRFLSVCLNPTCSLCMSVPYMFSLYVCTLHVLSVCLYPTCSLCLSLPYMFSLYVCTLHVLSICLYPTWSLCLSVPYMFSLYVCILHVLSLSFDIFPSLPTSFLATLDTLLTKLQVKLWSWKRADLRWIKNDRTSLFWH